MNFRQQIKFYNYVSWTIRKGILKRPNYCSNCFSEKYIVAHHEDYSKPLIVIWLCRRCHKALHRSFLYPFGKMDIGDCFDFPAQLQKRIRSAAIMFAKGKMKFATRKIDDKIYICWRIE